MESIKYTCDECGVEKKEANHWFRVSLDKTSPGEEISIEICTWNLTLTLEEQHLCSESCLLKRISSLVGKKEHPKEMGIPRTGYMVP